MPVSPIWDYERALAYLLGRIDYERWTAAPYDDVGFKLDRMRALLERLGNPERGLPIVHIAGTKGKGSTAAMISSALTAAGYRTGTFTSPHLERIEERVSIDGQPISAERFAELVSELADVSQGLDREAIDRHGPTYFELTTALALLYFRRSGADWAVLEVGMGGRLDCTNVCLPRVSVITSISFDHTKQLGNTLALIAREKAGIIKPGVPVVSGVLSAAPRDVIRDRAAAQRSPLAELNRDFTFEHRPPSGANPFAPGAIDFRATAPYAACWPGIQLGLTGAHQAANAAVALATLLELRRQGWDLPEERLRSGLASASSAARIEVLGKRPWLILDVAHNVASAQALADCLRGVAVRGQRVVVLGVSRDKDVAGMLRALAPAFDRLIATKFLSNPRGLDAETLAAMAAKAGFRQVETAPDPAAAWARAQELAGPDDLVCATGSFFLAGEIRPLLLGRPASASAVQP